MSDHPSLPTGTVTLLFTDIEGSTLLLARLGARYVDILDGQREIQRAAWAAHGGHELGTEGDSFFVAFATAGQAVAAAAQAQRGLAAHPWPEGVAVRVRMGMHTGTPARHADGYVGIDVHRAARVAGAAHGGQVLLSGTTSALVAGDLPAGVGLGDLGEYRLKDIAAPERLCQLTGSGLDGDFPPPRTLGSLAALPRPASELIGRDAEAAALGALLTHPGLVTVTGPGGTGKTRLAVELAHRSVGAYRGGVFFVPLERVTTAAQLWDALGEVLGVGDDDRVAERLPVHLAGRAALVVLDNLEQVEAADRAVLTLVESSPELTVLATSRSPLGLRVERPFPLAPLDTPAAVRMFAAEAARVRTGFALTEHNAEDVAAIVERLDGLPLAVELVARRLALMSPHQLLDRLDDVLDLADPAPDRPARQVSLRATVDWSYRLLSPAQQELFRLLGVMRGPAGVETVQSLARRATLDVPVLDGLAGLVAAGLLTTAEEGDDVRLTMLGGIRAYARELLLAGPGADAVRTAHAEHLRDLVVRFSTALAPRSAAARNRFESGLADLRAALDWCLVEAPDGERVRLAVGICAGTGRMWRNSAHQQEGRHRLGLAVESARHAAGSESWGELAYCHLWLGFLHLEDDLEAAGEQAAVAADLLARLGPAGLPSAQALVGRVRLEQGDLDGASALLEEAVAGAAAQAAGTARLDLRYQYLTILNELGVLRTSQGRHAEGLEAFAGAAAQARALGDVNQERAELQNRAWTLAQMGRAGEAAEVIVAVVPDVLAEGVPRTLAELADDFAEILAGLTRWDDVLRLLDAAEAYRSATGLGRPPSQRDRPARLRAAAYAAGAVAGQVVPDVKAVLAELAQEPNGG